MRFCPVIAIDSVIDVPNPALNDTVNLFVDSKGSVDGNIYDAVNGITMSFDSTFDDASGECKRNDALYDSRPSFGKNVTVAVAVVENGLFDATLTENASPSGPLIVPYHCP